MTQVTMIIVIKMHKLPINIVTENLEMSRIQAIPVNITNSTIPGVQGPTVTPNIECKRLTHVSVKNTQKDILKEN